MTVIEEAIYGRCVKHLNLLKRQSVLAVLKKLCALYGLAAHD